MADGPVRSGGAAEAGAFLPVGYPRGKGQTTPVIRTVNRDMSYESSHRKPRHAGRRSHAITPEEAWPALEGDVYAQGTGYRGAGQEGAEPQASYQPAPGYQSQPGYQDAYSGSASYGYGGASGGYAGTADGYAGTSDGWGPSDDWR